MENEKYRTYKWKAWLLATLFLVVFFAFHNERFYPSAIGKITKVTEKENGSAGNYNSEYDSEKEITYEQTCIVRILNGEYKGEKITVKNSYSYSQVDTEKYRRGDKVFLSITGEKHISYANITGVKRDQYAVLMIAVLSYLVIVLAGRRGIRTLLSLLFNIAVFAYGLKLYDQGVDLLVICNVLIVLFTVVTLFLVNGVNKRTLAAILSALVTEVLVIFLFRLAMKYGGEIDYAALDYITGDQDLETIFIASISIAGLGATMDVGVSIAAALNELVVKNPKIPLKNLIHSGRELGYDIMGTMINVLLFTYLCGLFPVMIIEMKNSVRLLTILRLQIPFEICRFLIGGIGILAAIPVSILISTVLLKLHKKSPASGM
ncbi:MAG: YibE/F family protein [Hespellia sp.]|nr:YibE/F family protein [Hespellia sp.]